MEVGERNLNYCEYRGYAIAIEKIKLLGGQWNYATKALLLKPGNLHPAWEESATGELWGKDIDDAVSKCKQEIDKLF